MELKEIALSEIILDKSTQPRAAIDDFIVNEYRLDMASGDEFPPLMVFTDNGKYYLADGWHRYLAAQQLQKETVQCAIKEGGLREAILYSCAANSDHGKRRTNGDKERAVKKLLSDPEWVKWSDHEIARRCNVTQPFVSKLRPSDTDNDYQYRNFIHPKTGQTAQMNTANIGKPKEPEQEPEFNEYEFNRQQILEANRQGAIIEVPPARENPQKHEYDALNYRLFTSPIDQLSQHLEANSIDAIITDPPYPKEYIHCYKELAEQAAIILRDGGILVALCGHLYLPEYLRVIMSHLTYHWLGVYYMPEPPHYYNHDRLVQSISKPIIIATKGKWIKKRFIDTVINDAPDKEFHKWGQGITGFKRLVESFTLPNETILDPFVGGGTTAIAALECGRYFIGSDISEEEVQKTKGRLQ